MPLVSILVPVYKTEKYIEQCLDSLINQTLKDIEIICVNDGSPDKCGEILDRYSKLDNRIKIINKNNGGLPSARNAGLNNATGDYIGFVDSDDFVDVKMFETMYKQAEKKSSDIVICGAHTFPNDIELDIWLEHALSPEDCNYVGDTTSILFEESGITPFIWRTLIRKELIDKLNFRLNEDIHIGEDLAAQFRLYPMAKKITVINDKLYYYRCFRKDSLMNAIVYSNLNKKVSAHIKLVNHIADEWLKNNIMCDMEEKFLKWSLEFIYNDFIKLSLNEKIQLSKEILPTWIKCGYYKNAINLEPYIHEMFNYIYGISLENENVPKISVILYADGQCNYIERTFESIIGEEVDNLEVICINNSVSDNRYSILHKYLHKDKRIRLFNVPKQSIDKILNIGIDNANGKYISFISPTDSYHSVSALKEWIDYADDNDSEICSCRYSIKEAEFYPYNEVISSDSNHIDYFLNNNFKCILYNKKFLNDFNIRFGDYSIITGKVFLINSYINAKRKSSLDRCIYNNLIIHKPDWIPTEKCEKLLNGIKAILEKSSEAKNIEVHLKGLSMLHNDYYNTIIVNNTLPYFGDEKVFPNGENSQVNTLEAIFEAVKAIDYDLIAEYNELDNIPCLPAMLIRFIEERHNFLKEF